MERDIVTRTRRDEHLYIHRGWPQRKEFRAIVKTAVLLGDSLTLLVLQELVAGPRRFTALQMATDIGASMLTPRLRRLCESGMLTRHMYLEIPPHVEYELTDKGRAALPVLDVLRAYGERWLSSHRAKL